MALFVAAAFLPKQAIIVPLSRFWSIVDLQMLLSNIGPFDLFALPWIQPYYATILELIVTHTAYGISICTLLFRGYYLTIDNQLIEAARIDGAGLVSIYRKIILPLSYPMFAVVCIFQFTQIWNEFLYGLVLTGGGNAAPATVALNNLNSGFAQLYNRQMAGAFVVALPTLLVYLLFGDQFVKGVQY
uniref:carbohydrate ABC transporter permease n=1 Tax=Halococcus agarilyticus TaxID=1232219 RepID=UPI0012AB6D88